MDSLTKTILYNALLFIGIYAVTSLTEWQINANKWSKSGVVFFVVVFCVWSVILTVKQMSNHERK